MMSKMIKAVDKSQHDRVKPDFTPLRIRKNRELENLIDMEFGCRPPETTVNDASVCAVGHTLALELKRVLLKRGFWRDRVWGNTRLLKRVCGAMYLVDMDDGELLLGKLLQHVVEEDDVADKAATMKIPYWGDEMQRFRAARWYARNNQYPDYRLGYPVWEYWASFDPPVQAPIGRYYQKGVILGSSLAMLKRVIELPGWDLDYSLHLCCQRNLRHVEYLLAHGADANAKSGFVSTPLTWSSGRGYKDIVEVLIKYGADLNAMDDDGEIALTLAVRKGHEEVALLLVEHGADLNLRNRWDHTALIEAAHNKQERIAKVLIEKGADLHAMSSLGRPALQIFRYKGCKEIVDLLLKHGAKDVYGVIGPGWPWSSYYP